MRDNSVRLDDLMPLIRERLAAGESVSFSPRGTSMLPMLREGKDRVVLSPLPMKLKKYDLPLYQREDGQYVLHRIVKAGELFTCMGDNQFVPESGIRRGQMIALATVIVRKEKEYSADSFGYKVYCRFWHYSRPLRRILRWMRMKMYILLKHS